MVGCIFWRRKRKKQSKREKRMNDVELTARRKAKVEGPSEGWNMEKEARGWAKASARWRANIRHSARRRKNRRHAVSTGRLSRPQSPILTEAREVSLPPSSLPSSRRHSVASICEDLHAAVTPHSPENSSTPTEPVLSPVLSIPRMISSPPAYMFPAPQTEDCPQGTSHVNPGEDMSCRESILLGRPDFPSAPKGDVPYQPNYTGHVAIDDKAHLARLAGLASAPPPANEGSTGESSLAVHESAPEWHDVDLEELHSHSDTIATPLTSPFDIGISGFPTPPSKSVVSSRYFDGHSYLEDISTLDPIILPSMPPYEAGSSALPFEEAYASAPPLLDDDQTWESSAPEASDGDHNTIPSSSTQPDQACVGGGALPIYQP